MYVCLSVCVCSRCVLGSFGDKTARGDPWLDPRDLRMVTPMGDARCDGDDDAFGVARFLAAYSGFADAI